MGLPIWRDPDESRACSRTKQHQHDPTASLRSAIRRRSSVHGRRGTRSRLSRHSSQLPPRFERSPPPSSGFNGLRESSRRGEDRGIPPISNLLEAADRDRIVLPHAPAERFPPTMHLRTDGVDDEAERAARTRLTRHMDSIQQRQVRLRREREYVLDDSTDSDVHPHRSPTPPTNRNDSSMPIHTILLNPGEPLRLIRSPEPMSRRSRPHSRNGSYVRRNALPTPPLDRSASDESVEAFHERRGPAHPLSNSWRPESPVGGLGDRDRSPTPGDGWEIMRTTIAPDETLPSAESSFASAAASQSFNASSSSTQVTEPDVISLDSRRNADDQSDSASSIDPEDLGCIDVDDDIASEAFAHEMYMFEMQTSAGRQRVASHERFRAQEGNRYALTTEPERVDIGFRLIEEALNSTEGRERLLRLRNNESENIDQESAEAAVRMVQRLRERRHRREPSQLGRSRHGSEAVEVSLSRREVHDFFSSLEAGARAFHSMSPPPQYEPLNSHPDVNTFTSRERLETHPVSPPSQRSEREVSEALLSGDIQDLDSIRQIIERLATRDDVPEEWWMSMGLNLSRTRPRDRSPRRRSEESRDVVRAGRIERSNSRL